jgi:hypothetical protein
MTKYLCYPGHGEVLDIEADSYNVTTRGGDGGLSFGGSSPLTIMVDFRRKLPDDSARGQYEPKDKSIATMRLAGEWYVIEAALKGENE